MVSCCLSSDEIQEHLNKNRDKIKDSHEASELKFVDFSLEGIDNVLRDETVGLGYASIFILDCLRQIL